MHALNRLLIQGEIMVLADLINLVSTSLILAAFLLLRESMTELISSGVEGNRNNELFMLNVGKEVKLVDSTVGIFFAMFFPTFAK